MWKYKIYFDTGNYFIEGSLPKELSLKDAQDSILVIISKFEGIGLEVNTWYLW